MTGLEPGGAAEPVRLSGEALAALAALARDGGGAAVAPAVRAELDELGATDAAGRVAPSWFPVADALAAPVGRVRLLQRRGTRTRRTDGWIAPGAAVLAVGGEGGHALIAAAPGGELPALLARLVALGPRSGPPGREPVRLSRAELAAVIGHSQPVGSPTAGPQARSLWDWRAQWRASVAWRVDADTVVRDGCDVLDTPEGLWLVEPVDDDDVVCGPATPELVWRRLLSLLPSAPEGPATGGWRTCQRPELGLCVDVPASWRSVASRPGWFAVREPDAEGGGGVPTTVEVGLVPPAADSRAAGAEETLTAFQRDLTEVWLLDTADDELAGRPARRHLYHHVVDGVVVVTVAWAAVGPDGLTHVAIGSSATARFLSELAHLTGVAASLRATGPRRTVQPSGRPA